MINNVKSEHTILYEINDYIGRALPYSSWYIGIAKDARERLFYGHNVSEKDDLWIYRKCENDKISRAIEQYFLKLGCKGGDGGGDHSSSYIYAYKITNTTVE